MRHGQRRRPRPLGPTPRYSAIPRWGLYDRFDQDAGADATEAGRRGPTPSAVRRVVVTTLAEAAALTQLRAIAVWRDGPDGGREIAAQRFVATTGYLVLLAAPLAAISGYRMSGMWPKGNAKLSAAYPIEWARKIHFPVMLYFVLFIIVHVALVFATGALRNLNHMFAARDDAGLAGFWVFTAAMVVTAAPPPTRATVGIVKR